MAVPPVCRYSSVSSARLLGVRPSCINSATSTIAPCTIVAVFVDDKPQPASVEVELGKLEPGAVRRVRVRVAVLRNADNNDADDNDDAKMAPIVLRDLSHTTTIVNSLLADIFERRTFNLQRSMGARALLLADAASVVPLFWLDVLRAQLIAVESALVVQVPARALAN